MKTLFKILCILLMFFAGMAISFSCKKPIKSNLELSKLYGKWRLIYSFSGNGGWEIPADTTIEEYDKYGKYKVYKNGKIEYKDNFVLVKGSHSNDSCEPHIIIFEKTDITDKYVICYDTLIREMIGVFDGTTLYFVKEK